MSNFPQRQLNQKAVYWGAPISDGYGGFSWADPVEIDCRWSDSARVITTHDGSELVCRAEVQVAQDLDEQGMLLLGVLEDLESGDYNDPVNAEAWAIVRFDKVPTIKGDKFFRKAYMSTLSRRAQLG